MSLKWQAREPNVPAAPIPMPPLIWQTLVSRGVDAEDLESYIKPTLQSLRSPFTMLGMAEAVERMVQAFHSGEPLCVYADFDLDGTSALALLKTGLEELGFKKVSGYQPRRLAEGYGVHATAVREIFESGVKLMVTVDVGITAHEALKTAKDLGMDVIVTDHHLPQGPLPEAFALINPNQGHCPSGLGHLAGVGVALYLLLGVRSRLKELKIGRFDFDVRELLDFFVIGTLTDMVPLRAENRPLVRHGLKRLAQTRRPGLRALLDRLELSGRDLGSQDVAIKFSPKLNALSRLESAIRPIDMMLAMDPTQADEMAAEVLACNQRRVEIQKSAEAEARAQVGRQQHLTCCFAWSGDFHRGVVGLVATRLAQEFNRPAFVGSVDEKGRIVGSARLPKKQAYSLIEALEGAREKLLRFGGHAQAAGFETDLERVEDLHRALHEHFKNQSQEVSSVLYDGEADLSEVTPELMKWQEGLEPFGSEFDLPVYRLRGVRIRKVSELRGGHLRLDLEAAKSGDKKTAIWFSPPKEASFLIQSATSGFFEILGEVQWNYFQGRKSLQLLLKDLRRDERYSP